MFLFWNWFPWITCYNRYSLYCRGFVTGFVISTNWQSSFGFGVFNFVLTLRRHCLTISLFVSILLRILKRSWFFFLIWLKYEIIFYIWWIFYTEWNITKIVYSVGWIKDNRSALINISNYTIKIFGILFAMIIGVYTNFSLYEFILDFTMNFALEMDICRESCIPLDCDNWGYDEIYSSIVFVYPHGYRTILPPKAPTEPIDLPGQELGRKILPNPFKKPVHMFGRNRRGGNKAPHPDPEGKGPLGRGIMYTIINEKEKRKKRKNADDTPAIRDGIAKRKKTLLNKKLEARKERKRLEAFINKPLYKRARQFAKTNEWDKEAIKFMDRAHEKLWFDERYNILYQWRKYYGKKKKNWESLTLNHMNLREEGVDYLKARYMNDKKNGTVFERFKFVNSRKFLEDKMKECIWRYMGKIRVDNDYSHAAGFAFANCKFYNNEKHKAHQALIYKEIKDSCKAKGINRRRMYPHLKIGT